MSYRVKLNIFEGPFDLLVYLIERAEMNIYDIKISEIVKQYMEYIKTMEKSDINVSSEFMVLAAALLEIKSKMLLPREEINGGNLLDLEDPRLELVAKLVEYKRYKNISENLEQRHEKALKSLGKPREDLTIYTKETDEYLSLDMKSFKEVFEQFLQRKKKIDEIRKHHIRSQKQKITIEHRIESIRNFFRETMKHEVDFKDLIHEKKDLYDVAVTFSSVLEMMKAQDVEASQKRIFGDIEVKPTEQLFKKES